MDDHLAGTDGVTPARLRGGLLKARHWRRPRTRRRGPARRRAGAMDRLEPDPPQEQPATRATFGALLRRHRLAAGLTQEGLAERAGLSVQALSALETGRRRAPYRHTVAVLASALGLSEGEAATLQAAVVRTRATSPAPALDARVGPDESFGDRGASSPAGPLSHRWSMPATYRRR